MSKPFDAADLRRHIAQLLAVTAASWSIAAAKARSVLSHPQNTTTMTVDVSNRRFVLSGVGATAFSTAPARSPRPSCTSSKSSRTPSSTSS